MLYPDVVTHQPVARAELEGVSVLPARALDVGHHLLREGGTVSSLDVPSVQNVPPEVFTRSGVSVEARVVVGQDQPPPLAPLHLLVGEPHPPEEGRRVLFRRVLGETALVLPGAHAWLCLLGGVVGIKELPRVQDAAVCLDKVGDGGGEAFVEVRVADDQRLAPQRRVLDAVEADAAHRDGVIAHLVVAQQQELRGHVCRHVDARQLLAPTRRPHRVVRPLYQGLGLGRGDAPLPEVAEIRRGFHRQPTQ
mmetsp:Transcript_489/g.1029  ORF Transcript_489/g.1029 Transcript_489/m.1029 type:complete len:250 (-) Transcript_489:382-1131(-)